MYVYVLLYIMGQIQFDLSAKADKKVKQYMLDNDITDKGIAVNKILEGM